MTFFNLTSTEIMLLVLLAVVILGPRRLPHYAARLADLVRRVRDLAEGAKEQIKQEMGPAFEDVDWRQLDPRQYDPRRIVREALTTPSSHDRGPSTGATSARAAAPRQAGLTPAPAPRGRPTWHDPSLPTPFDVDAT